MAYRQKLLVIEPDADTAQRLGESLTAQGYEVRLIDNAGGAMLLLRYYEPDAVLLAQIGEESSTLPRVAPLPSDENWSLVTLCRLWKIPVIYMLETPDSPCKRVWDDNFFR